jgi:fructokinase
MPDVIACGEMLIDFISTVQGVSLADAPAFEKAAGGAPANVAAGIARHGLRSGFIGKVGDDDFGRFLGKTLANNGVDTQGLRYSKEAHTGLAFVSLRADGEREFIFYRHPSADMLFDPDDVDSEYIASARAFHYGSITFGAERSRAGTLHALEIAQANGLFLSYDPNVRLSLWPSARAAYEAVMLGWPHANLIKISEEEAALLAEMRGYGGGLQETVQRLWHERLRLVVVTGGPSGCYYFTRLPLRGPVSSGHVPGFSVASVDATGAGDAFLAALISRLYGMFDALLYESISEAELQSALRYANAAGALTTTRRGAIAALPTRGEVEAFLARTED